MNAFQTRFTYWIAFISLSLFSISAHAATFYASVSKNKVVNNEVFQLRLVSDQKASSDDIDFSVLNSDFSLGRPSFGSSINIINSKRTNRSEWTVSLAAKRTGILTIPSFELEGVKTQPIAIQVSKDEQAPETKDLVDVQTQLSKSQLYPNESAILKARLIIKADPRRLQNPTVTPPSVYGLELKAASEANQYQTILDGVEVTIVDQDFRITAKQAGTFSLSEPKFKGTIIYGSNYSGGTRLVPIETQAKSYTITVKPKPENFKGTWLPTSRLTLNQNWTDSQGNAITNDHYKTRVGESITREVTLQVSGLTQEQLPNIKIEYPTSLSEYAEKPQFSTQENGDVVMTIKQVLIPRQSGDISLASISVNWWNTNTQQQQTSSLNGLTLSVGESETPLAAAPTPLQMPAKVETVTVHDSGIWPYLTALFAILWLITATVAWRFKSRQSVNEPKSAANSIGSNEFNELKDALSTGDGIKISRSLKAWQATVVFSDEEQASVEQALSEVNQSLYSSEPSSIQTRELQQLAERIQKQQAKRRQQSTPPLAKL